jgi:hypothetical protein
MEFKKEFTLQAAELFLVLHRLFSAFLQKETAGVSTCGKKDLK